MVVVVCVGQLVFGHMGYVVSQKQTPHWMLDAFGHLHDILQDFFRRNILGFDVNGTSCDQQIPVRESVKSGQGEGNRAATSARDQHKQNLQARENVPRMLHHAIQILHRGTFLVQVRKEMLKVHKLIRDRHV